jgi:hypothetical protein
MGINLLAFEEALSDVVHGLECFCELVRGDGFTVNVYPLRRFYEVRRGVQTGANASFFENAGEHGTSRAFAVGARDMDEALPILRVTQPGKESLHAFQTPLRARLELIPEGVKIAYGIGITQLVFRR